MQSWTAPEPRAPRRNWFYCWAVVGWTLTVALAYWGFSSETADSVSDSGEAEASEVRAAIAPGARTTETVNVTAIPAPPSTTSNVTPPRSGSVDSPCEDFLKESIGPIDGRLPTHLERSAVDVFIGENAWAKPCRGRRRHTAQLCVAIQDGQVRGLSVTIAPPDLTLETCLREQAAKLVLQPEGSVRVVRTKLVL